MNVSRVLAIVATILFGVGFVLLLGKSADAKLIQELLFLGLALFAGAHCID